MKKTGSAIIVFGRLPFLNIPAKTRLGQELNAPELTTELGHLLTRRTLKRVGEMQNITPFFCFGGDEKQFALEFVELSKEFPKFHFFPQVPHKDVRGMKESFEYVFQQGLQKILLIGTDIIGLEEERLEELLETLDFFDICVQPMEDQGYGALGMSKEYDLFTEIQNFTSHTAGYDLLAETQYLCTQKNISLFVHPEKLFDIDTTEDLEQILKNNQFWDEPQWQELQKKFLQIPKLYC